MEENELIRFFFPKIIGNLRMKKDWRFDGDGKYHTSTYEAFYVDRRFTVKTNIRNQSNKVVAITITQCWNESGDKWVNVNFTCDNVTKNVSSTITSVLDKYMTYIQYDIDKQNDLSFKAKSKVSEEALQKIIEKENAAILGDSNVVGTLEEQISATQANINRLENIKLRGYDKDYVEGIDFYLLGCAGGICVLLAFGFYLLSTTLVFCYSFFIICLIIIILIICSRIHLKYFAGRKINRHDKQKLKKEIQKLNELKKNLNNT